MQHSLAFFPAPDLDEKGGKHLIAYQQWGSPVNPRKAICVHGLSRNSHDFDYLAAAMSNQYHVICPDMAGRGKSEWLGDPAQYNYATYVADCIALMAHLNIGAAHWVGTSLGGIIGMMIASMYPGKITRLVLNDIGSAVAAEGLRRIASYAGKDAFFPTMEAAEARAKTIFEPFGITQPDHWAHLMRHSFVKNTDGTVSFAYDQRIIEPFRRDTENFTTIADIDLSVVWEGVSCPVLLIRGMKSDILRAETAQAMQKGKPNVQLIELPGIGHAPALMDANQIKMVAAWLLGPENGAIRTDGWAMM